MKGVLSLVAINVVFRHPKSLNKKTIYFGPTFWADPTLC